ncbi:FkbM family methyltransferase [Roseomonas hellenica]|uniref:FkbM family methyltransferase n=1 Tax=Plastoroseomonas hellenica TaxID=2687306 RepID=A0ABS5F899_9PROT|nr:FkbM family methyltransferase [Plastoroseomonas hellenica]MBR0668785.1 FkbM family methyltransferase [Plastoroseomonas hellenica]
MRNAFREIAIKAALRIPQIRMLHQSRRNLIAERNELLTRLAHPYTQERGSPFFHYHSPLFLEGLVERHAVPEVAARPGYLVNFLGVAIDPKFAPESLAGRAGQVEGLPTPATWHADIAEWGAALRAVDLARDTFTAIELGCGWACWLNNTGAAARRAGLRVHLIGVEGDEGHLSFAREAFAANWFSPDQFDLHRGIAAAAPGIALFPRQDQAGAHWGLEPIFGASEEQRQGAVQSGKYDALPMLPLSDLAEPHHRIDLLHVDIQGGEADLVTGSLDTLNAKVAYLVVGTHSRQIEGRLMETLLGAGWELEVERPAILAISNAVPTVRVDGVQGWRNPRLSVTPPASS